MSNRDAIAEVIGLMLEASIKGDADAFSLIAQNESIENAVSAVKEGQADRFRYLVLHPIESILQQLIRSSMISGPSATKENLRHAEFLFMNSDVVERHYRHLFDRFEGMCCCADKSKNIMRQLLAFFTTGKKIEFDYSQEYSYHLPAKIFKTHDEIVDFFYGLHDLHYGRPDRYALALSDVLKKGAL